MLAEKGFTLLELMLVILIAAVLLLWGMPSVVQSLRNNDVAAQNVSLLAMLNFTKSESIRRNTTVNLVFTMTDDGWNAIVEDPNNEADIEGCVLGQLRCTSNTGAVLTIASLDGESPSASPSMDAPSALPGPEPEPEPVPVPDPEPQPDPVETGTTFELSFNNRGYIRGSDDAWAPETFFLQHEQCSGQNQRRRVDITPTGQVSSCSLACDSRAACP